MHEILNSIDQLYHNDNVLNEYLNTSNEIKKSICIYFLNKEEFLLLIELDENFKEKMVYALVSNVIISKEDKIEIFNQFMSLKTHPEILYSEELFDYFVNENFEVKYLKYLYYNPKIIDYVIEHPEGFKRLPWDLSKLLNNPNYYKFFDKNLKFINKNYHFFVNDIIFYFNSERKKIKQWMILDYFTFDISFVENSPVITEIYEKFINDPKSRETILKSAYMYEINQSLNLDLEKNIFNNIDSNIEIIISIYLKRSKLKKNANFN